MIPLQDVLRPFYIRVILGHFVPGQIQQRFQIPSFHGGLGAALSQALKTVDFLLNLFLYFLARLQLIQLLLELFGIRHHIVLAQLLTDIIHLFPEHIFLLVFLHPRLYLLRKLRTDFGNLDFFIKDSCQYLVTGIQIDRLQHLLLLIEGNRHAFNQFIH